MNTAGMTKRALKAIKRLLKIKIKNVKWLSINKPDGLVKEQPFPPCRLQKGGNGCSLTGPKS